MEGDDNPECNLAKKKEKTRHAIAYCLGGNKDSLYFLFHFIHHLQLTAVIPQSQEALKS